MYAHDDHDRTLVTELMSLPYDTTVHYIAVHLHPFAESLELIDLTTGKNVRIERVYARIVEESSDPGIG